jgi:hypothetical protein
MPEILSQFFGKIKMATGVTVHGKNIYLAFQISSSILCRFRISRVMFNWKMANNYLNIVYRYVEGETSTCSKVLLLSLLVCTAFL